VNANQRYATDGLGAAEVIRACRAAGVPYQEFVSRSDLPCGSTIGPVTAGRLGVPTVDVGIAQLAMHSCRETAGALDPLFLTRALTAFF
jgi:aspartyl aminopeptidase